MRTIEIELQGSRYLWNGSTWTDHRFLRPPTRVRTHLMKQLVRKIRHTRTADLNLDLVVQAANACMEEGHLADARKLAERALRADASHVGAATVLAAVLRKDRLPRRAIKVTDKFQRRHDAGLLTVRAAAFADISDWDNAEKFVKRALAVEKTESSTETLKVLARVVSARSRSAA